MHAAKHLLATSAVFSHLRSFYQVLFSGGHAPTENSLTRVQLRRVAAKPRRSAGLNWPEKPAKRFEGQILDLGLGDGQIGSAGAFPAKSSILWESFIEFVDFG